MIFISVCPTYPNQQGKLRDTERNQNKVGRGSLLEQNNESRGQEIFNSTALMNL